MKRAIETRILRLWEAPWGRGCISLGAAALPFLCLVAGCMGNQADTRVKAKVAENIETTVSAEVVGAQLVDELTATLNARLAEVVDAAVLKIANEGNTTTGVTGPALVALAIVGVGGLVAVWFLKTRIYKHGYHADNWERKRRGGESRAETLTRLEQEELRRRKAGDGTEGDGFCG